MATPARKPETVYQDALVNYLISMARTVEGTVNRAIQVLLNAVWMGYTGENNPSFAASHGIHMPLTELSNCNTSLSEFSTRRRTGMRIILRWILGVLLAAAATPLAAQTQMARGTPVPPPAKAEGKAEPATAAPAATAEKSEKSDKEKVELEILAALQDLRQKLADQSRELEAQRALIQQQQAKLEALEARGGNTPPAGGTGTAEPASLGGRVDQIAAAQEDLGQKVKSVEADLDKTKKSVEGKMKGFGPFSFSGDLRARYEPFFGGGATSSPAPQDRNRFRYRLRVNANAKFNDEFAGGFTIASGDPGDPISTNQTFTSFFVRKPILVDKAWLTYSPRWWKPLSVTVGKWGYTWYRTEMVWDNDLNPEGISEQVMWNWKDSPLEHFGIVAFQLPIFEVSGGPDAGLFGGQIQTGWKITDRVKVTADAAFYNYRKADPIAANQNSGLGSFGSGFGGSTFTNYSGTLNGARAYASQFGILDTILRLDFDTGRKAFPLMAQLNFAQNTKACGNLQAFVDAEATVPFCDPKQRQAYMAEVQLGRTQEKGDMRLAYKFARIEREAVVSAFNFSDFRQATNVASHWIEYSYQAYQNINLGFTALIGRQLRTPTSTTTRAPEERFLKRLQMDVFYKF